MRAGADRHAGAAGDGGGVADDRGSAANLDRAPALLGGEHRGDGRARGAGERAQLLLRDPDLLAVPARVVELEQPPKHSPLRALVERLAQQLVHAVELLREQAHEHPVDARVLVPQPVEVDPVDAQRLGGVERGHGRRPVLVGDERELAERLARPADREQRLLSDRRPPRDREPALHHEVERVTRIVLVEDDLATLERPPSRDSEDGLQVVRGDAIQQLPTHRRLSS